MTIIETKGFRAGGHDRASCCAGATQSQGCRRRPRAAVRRPVRRERADETEPGPTAAGARPASWPRAAANCTT